MHRRIQEILRIEKFPVQITDDVVRPDASHLRRGYSRRASLTNARLAGVFQVKDSFRYRSWKVDEQEMALVVQVVLAAFIHDTHEVILGGPRIGNDPVDLAWNERCLVIGVVDTQSKWLCRLFHFSSKYLLIFKSRFPIPWALYQCNESIPLRKPANAAVQV